MVLNSMLPPHLQNNYLFSKHSVSKHYTEHVTFELISLVTTKRVDVGSNLQDQAYLFFSHSSQIRLDRKIHTKTLR